MEATRRPAEDDAMKNSEEDDDLNSLRLKLIQAKEENEELRNRIIEQIKQTNVLIQDGAEDVKALQTSDAIFQKLRNRVFERVKRSNFINKDGPDDMKAAQITDAIFQQVRSSVTEQVKQSNGMTPRQISDAIIQELRDKARKIMQSDDYINEELRSTADSAFNSMAEIKPQGRTEDRGDQIVRAETNAANPPVAIPLARGTNEPSELAPGVHPADNSGINLEVEEKDQGAAFSPHIEPVSSPPIQFHGDPSLLSEALLPPIQFDHYPEAPELPPRTPGSSWLEYSEADDAESDLTGFD